MNKHFEQIYDATYYYKHLWKFPKPAEIEQLGQCVVIMVPFRHKMIGSFRRHIMWQEPSKLVLGLLGSFNGIPVITEDGHRSRSHGVVCCYGMHAHGRNVLDDLTKHL